MWRRNTWYMVIIFLLFSGISFSKPIVPQHLAGSWYPKKRKQLELLLSKFLKNSHPISPLVKGRIIGLISPHAGMIYSGWCAIHGYKLLKGKKINTVVIIGPSHYYAFPGIATLKNGYFETPLGKVYIDDHTVDEILRRCNFARILKEPFLQEHSVEIELPYLQYFIGSDFKVVPIIFGTRSISLSKQLGDILYSVLRDKNALVIASSDLSHYHSEKDAFYLDRRTLNFVKDLDVNGLFDCSMENLCEACGLGPILCLMQYARRFGIKKGVVLNYSTSSLVTGDKKKVVGYGCVIFTKGEEFRGINLGFSDSDGLTLIRIARKAIEGRFKEEEEEINIPESLKVSGYGAFVTLKRRGFLRGCIGSLYGNKPLYKLVHDMAIEAAFSDPRFPPLKEFETIDLDIEVSILTKPQKVKNIEEIKIGRDGLIIRKGWMSGLLLPQVPVEFGWDRIEFLRRTCEKAGLPKNCWKSGEVEIYAFQAQVF